MAVLKKSPGSIVPNPDENQSTDQRETVTSMGQLLRLCPGCGRMFEPYRSFQHYCSDRCRIKVTSKRPSRYIKKPAVLHECYQCHQVFKTSDGKRRYCSKECYDLSQLARRVRKEVRQCFECGKKFETSHWAKRYCSEECRRLSHAKT